MFNHLKEMMEKQREKAATDSEETTQKFGHLEEELRMQQEEERQRLAERRVEERREAEAERERAAREAELVVERMETRVAAVQDDVKQRQLQVPYLQIYIFEAPACILSWQGAAGDVWLPETWDGGPKACTAGACGYIYI